MIQYIKDSSLFASEADAIVNTVNCKGVMGKGLAFQFKKRYPKMFEEYKEKCSKGEIRPGILHIFQADDHIIINFPTKDDWRKKSKVKYIKDGLSYFQKHYKEWGIKSVAFPQLGCGTGGLQWKTVKKIMKKYLANIDIPVEIYVNLKREYIRELQKLFDKLETDQLKIMVDIAKQFAFRKITKNNSKQTSLYNQKSR